MFSRCIRQRTITEDTNKPVYYPKPREEYSMNYYLDNISGNDSSAGTSPDTAWKSLVRANQTVFAPGDSLYLASGSVWHGSLKPNGCGADDNRCVIAPYGIGPRPVIHADGEYEAAVHLRNTDGWTVRGLEVTNTGAERANHRTGILAEIQDYGTGKGLTIEDNYIHDVNGSNVKSEGDTKGGIIVRCSGRKVRTRWINVDIRRNHILRCDRIGIYFSGGNYSRLSWFPSLNVVIYGNLLEDIGGDGILNIATDGCVIERNRLLGGRLRDNMYCAGIWPWSSDNTIICYNEAAYYHGTKDGQGFDCDYNCVGTTHMYNYSHDNEGGYMLVCTSDRKHNLPDMLGTMNTTIYRNLSVNDLCRTFHIAGPAVGTRIEQNCIYTGEGIDIPCFLFTGAHEPMGPTETCLITKNIFASRGMLRYAEATARHEDGTFSFDEVSNPPYAIFCGNAFLGSHSSKPEDTCPPADHPSIEEIESVVIDKDGHARAGLETLDDFLDMMGWPHSLK